MGKANRNYTRFCLLNIVRHTNGRCDPLFGYSNIYIYIYRERERKREIEGERERFRQTLQKLFALKNEQPSALNGLPENRMS